MQAREFDVAAVGVKAAQVVDCFDARAGAHLHDCVEGSRIGDTVAQVVAETGAVCVG